MSRVFTRQDVEELIAAFKDQVIPKDSGDETLFAGIKSVEEELSKSSGSPSIKLREYARVLKHFVGGSKDKDVVHQANHALAAVGGGENAAKAIKRSRLWNHVPLRAVS